MKSIRSTSYFVHFGKKGFEALASFLESENISSIFILVDENTQKLCLPIILEKIPHLPYQKLLIASGEAHKNLETCRTLWNKLTEKGADRKSLLINIGGGVITD